MCELAKTFSTSEGEKVSGACEREKTLSSFQFSSRWYLRSEKHICAPARLSEVSPTFPLKQFQCSSDWRWPSLVLLRTEDRPGDRWCDVLDFVPAGSVSSFSTLQIFRETCHLWGLLCKPVYLLCRFRSLQQVHPKEFSKADVDYRHIPPSAFHSIFRFL